MARKKDKKLSKGDDVSWKSHGQDVEGTVKRRIDQRTEAAGRTVEASEERPQYEVRSEKTGKSAVHRPESLRRRGSGGS
ncbi:DUF2945 domain-containing protein [Streptomyces sp. NPDC060184]|uniref:DUF2945 domain-containing protein n=1 Tax=Streptomyces sp. NPDC060184 TaxID=3347064 RepID=UPI0036519478